MLRKRSKGQFPKGSSGPILLASHPVIRCTMSFSFKYLDKSTPEFSLSDQHTRYLLLIAERLKDYSCFRVDELIANGSKTLRFHPIDWSRTAYKRGFPHAPKDLWDGASYQFSMGKSRGRIEGFIVGDVFYVGWADPNHKLYPM